jgi:hypothetical protein
MTLSQDMAGERPGSEPPPGRQRSEIPMDFFLGSLPFWGLLGYMIYDRRTAAELTRDGFRSLTEKTPPGGKQKQPDPPETEEPAKEWPGDGYRPQQLPRRTG